MQHVSSTGSDVADRVLIYRCPEHGLWRLGAEIPDFRPLETTRLATVHEFPQPLARNLGVLRWRLRDGANEFEGYIADCGVMGIELRLYFNGDFSFGARYDTLAAAQAELDFHHDEAVNRGFVQVFPAVAEGGVA
jgi:hypothetical protein